MIASIGRPDHLPAPRDGLRSFDHHGDRGPIGIQDRNSRATPLTRETGQAEISRLIKYAECADVFDRRGHSDLRD